MTQVNQCDACKKLPAVGNELELTGYTFPNNTSMEFWKGYICYGCLYKMRQSVKILGRRGP